MHSLERGFHIARWTACVIGCRGYVPQRERERERERNHIDPESHTRLDVGESIKISHRELSAERENISNIQPLRFSHPLLILAFIISARETFFIDWTRHLNFLSVFPQLWSFFFSSFCGYRGYEYVRRGCFHDACWVSLFFFWKKGKFLIFFWSPFILFIRLEFIFYYLGYYWRRLSAIL